MDLALLSELKFCKSARHLAARLEYLIESGVLTPGAILPSTREIAAFLDTSRTTVSRAFYIMEARGFLSARQGHGTIVSSHGVKQSIDLAPNSPRQFDWSERYSEISKERLNYSQSLPRWTGNSDFPVSLDLLPLAPWKSAFASAVTDKALCQKLCRADEPLGYLPLRKAVSGILQRYKGLLCPPSRIAIYSSAESALRHICELLVAPKDKIGCDNSIESKAFEILNSYGAFISPIKTDKNGLNVQDLLSIDSPTWLYVSEGGALLSQERSNRLCQWLRNNRAAVIESGDYSASCASTVSTAISSETSAHIFLYNFGPLLFPLNSFCCLVLPQELMALFERSKHLFDPRPLLVADHVVAALISNGTLEKNRHRAQKILKRRRQMLISALICSFARDIRITEAKSIFSICLRFHERWTKCEILTAAQSSDLPLYALEKAPLGSVAVSNEFSLAIAALNEDELQRRVSTFARKLRFANSVPYLLGQTRNLTV